MKLLLFSLSLLCSTFTFPYVINQVKINCDKSETCDFFKKNVQILKRDYTDQEEFYKLLRIFYSKTGYSSFDYEVISSGEKNKLILNIQSSRKLNEIIFNIDNSNIKTSSLSNILEINEGDYLDWYKLEKDEKRMLRKLNLQGFPRAILKKEIVEIGPQSVNLYFEVIAGNPDIINSISNTCEGKEVKSLMKRYFRNFKGSFFNREKIIQEIKTFENDLLGQGYYLSKVQFKVKKTNELVDIVLNCGNTEKITLSILDKNKFFEKENIYLYLRQYFQTTQRDFSESDLRRVIEELYVKKGFFRPIVRIETKLDNSSNKKRNNVFIQVEDTKRLRVRDVSFKGSNYFLDEELESYFYDKASDLTSTSYIDEDYYEFFIQLLKNKYTSAGFVDISVKYYIKTMTGRSRSVLFVINEGSRSIVKEIRISGQRVSELSSLKLGDPFDPTSFPGILEDYLSKVKEDGYFFAELNNEDDRDIVKYFNGNREVKINISLAKGTKSKVRNLLIFGVERTRKSVIRRKLHYVNDSFLTPELVKNIYSDIASLGIFKTYNVTFLRSSNADTDIVVRVSEKDYGVFELAPGFRTDIGLKVWSRISRSNLFGRNQTLSLTAQTNYRLSLGEIDDSRSNVKMYEYLGKINFVYPDFFKSYLDYYSSLSVSRTRFFSFDADINRISNSFRKEFNRVFSVSLAHQLENIEQYGAIDPTDNDTFRIGGVTPSLTLDLREKNVVIPKKGAHFQLSWEVAKPAFFSQKESDLTIDFEKTILRNRFYIPVSENFYVASSVSLGMQENKGGTRIPPIKVFRLTGVDIVRGFAEDEINIVDDGSGSDIADFNVTNKAYMTNFKFEPRYLLDDSMMLGFFYDAGSVQVDTYRPFDVRSSVGLSFKYVTPVGTLDFDYGIKLSRRRFADGTKESPGRIHVSIGFF